MTTGETCELCSQAIELGDDRQLELRHMAADDAPLLAELYAKLGPEDLRRRFFTAGQPPLRWFASWAAIAERGGFGLLAMVTEDGKQTIVAEAGYALLCSGDGELGVAVDPAARGWLGPWLLDALLQHANARAVPNMQALVLCDNPRMTALAKSRGSIVFGDADWSTIRLSMSTDGRVPSWPGDRAGDKPHSRPRVLLESDRSRWTGSQAAIRAGFDVLVCRGPGKQKHGCPLLRGESCPLVDGADVIVHLLNPDDPDTAGLMSSQSVIHSGLRSIEGFRADETTGEWERRSDEEIIADILEGGNSSGSTGSNESDGCDDLGRQT